MSDHDREAHDLENGARAVAAEPPPAGSNIAENLISSLGDIGTYQILVYLMSCFPVIIAGAITNSLIFITQAPPHRCYIAGCDGPANETTSAIFHAFHINFTIPKQADGVHWDQCHRYPRSTDIDECSAQAFLTNNTAIACDEGYVFDHEYFKTSFPMEVGRVI